MSENKNDLLQIHLKAVVLKRFDFRANIEKLHDFSSCS